MKLVTFPLGWHPYQELFSRAMSAHGIDIRPGNEFSNRDLLEHSYEVDGVNFQWVDWLWQATTPWDRVRLIIGFDRYCRLAKRLGKLIVWTVHNHSNHEGAGIGNALGMRSIARHADLVIAHSRWSEAFVRRTYRPAGRIVCMPHGNFDGYYNPRRSPSDVRSELGLRIDSPLCGMIGGVRSYRGVELAVEAVEQAKGGWQLLVAGLQVDAGFGRHVETLAARSQHTVCKIGKLSDLEYAELIQACDVILLPYRAITGSGTLLAAWTLSRPVVMSDLPFFREYRPVDEAAGMIMKSRTSTELCRCVEELLGVSPSTRQLAARREADRFGWEKVIGPVVEAFQQSTSAA